MDKIITQPELCDGCKDCERACEELYGSARISVCEVNETFYPIICQQCEDAPCQIICPTDAINNPTIDSDKCISCGLCMMVCPFGAVTVSETKAQKCNQCEGKDQPACIKACSKRAIGIVNTDALRDEKQAQHIARISSLGNSKKGFSVLDLITKTGHHPKK